MRPADAGTDERELHAEIHRALSFDGLPELMAIRAEFQWVLVGSSRSGSVGG